MNFSDPKINVTFNNTDNSIELSTDKFAYYVYIYLDDSTLKLTKNFFDLSPGWIVTTKITEKHKL